MREISIFLFGLFLFSVGLFSLIVIRAIGIINPDLFSILDLEPNPTTSGKIGFLFLTITGILYMIYPISKGLGWRYRIYLFSGSVLSAIVSAIFFVKLVSTGPGWLGLEILGIRNSNLTKISLVMTFIPLVSFLGGFSALLSEMEM